MRDPGLIEGPQHAIAVTWRHRLACLLLLALLAIAGTTPAQACESPFTLASAQRTVVDESGPHAQAALVPLPDTLAASLRREAVRVRYRFDVSACAGSGTAALWLFRVGAPYRIEDDAGRALAPLYAGGRVPADQWLAALTGAGLDVHNGRIPALFALPKGTRGVQVELLSLPYIPAGIVRAELGPTNLLLPLQAEMVQEVVGFADAASGVVLVLGVLALFLWLQRRADRGLLWLAVACGLWGVRGLVYFAPRVPLPANLFEQINPLLVLLASAALAASVLSLIGSATAKVRRGLWAATAACVAVLAVSLLASRGGLPVRAAMLATSFVMVSHLLVAVLRRRRQLAPWHVATLLAAVGGLLWCAVHDLLVVAGRLPPDEPSYVFWGFVLLLIGFAAMSGQYVVQTLNRAERSNEELERHVRRKTLELEESYTRLRENEREAARTHERERLLRDMHDGLGAQLMTVMRGVERNALGREQLKESLRDSLDELRLLMDSTDLGHYLPGALAAWRNRWDHRLEAAGVTLQWSIAEAVDDVVLADEATLQVMRILQEAATNIVKHAQARHMLLDARVHSTDAGLVLCILIRDDGVGLPPQPPGAGSRGLRNMRHRAAQIGASLAVQPRADARGTEVVLELPLAAPQAMSPRRAASIAASARDEMPSLR